MVCAIRSGDATGCREERCLETEEELSRGENSPLVSVDTERLGVEHAGTGPVVMGVEDEVRGCCCEDGSGVTGVASETTAWAGR